MSHHKEGNSRPSLERWPTAIALELVGPALAQVEMALNHGNKEEAYAAIDRAFVTAEPARVTLDSPIAELGLGPRLTNALEAGGVMTVRDLCEESEWSLDKLERRNRGRTISESKVQEIVRVVERHGYRLKEPMRAVQTA